MTAVNHELETAQAEDVLRWVWARFGPKACVTSSFQTQSVPLLHMISRCAPEMPVLFLDTGFHFPETLAFRDQLVRDLGLNVLNLKNRLGHQEFRRRHGELFRRDPDMCCFLNKVEPLDTALKDYEAWVTGIRRDQTATRQNAKVLQRLQSGTVKVAPMLNWTADDVATYMWVNELPEHPLGAQGYVSIGCAPCTARPNQGDERSGRWAGSMKTECGIHTQIGKPGGGKR